MLKFSPEVLAATDGLELLRLMHGRDVPDGLMYWLEFKNDNVFPTPKFGSIGGGSALKFGIFQRAIDGNWVTGHPRDLRVIDVAEAISIAERQRDRLLAGYERIASLPTDASDDQFAELQRSLETIDADFFNFSWVHKYFVLCFPDLIDDYHNVDYQKFHLVRLLVEPAAGWGRYVNAGKYGAIARDVGIELLHLTQLLNIVHGTPHGWRMLDLDYLGLTRDDLGRMRQQGIISPGFELAQDLSKLGNDQRGRSQLKDAAGDDYMDLWRFRQRTKPHDAVVVLANGEPVAAAEITGGYEYFHGGGRLRHRMTARWFEWPTGLDSLKEHRAAGYLEISAANAARDVVSIETALWRAMAAGPEPATISAPEVETLDQPRGKIQQALDRRKQVILYGPPGTGKTYWARETAQELAARHNLGKSWKALDVSERSSVWGLGPSFVRLATFHPSYGYEDFIEGFRPRSADGQLVFELRDGIFKNLCATAREHPESRYYLIIDEINRGDIPRIFGELITLIEADKRDGWPAILPLSGASFCVPDNVYMIGTMNTADKSIALLDSALRRRFGFVELMPDSSVLGETTVGPFRLADFLDALNERISSTLGDDGRNLQVGHSYFMADGAPIGDARSFVAVVAGEVFPLVQEYCYNRRELLAEVFGDELVDSSTGQIRSELLEGPPGQFLSAVVSAFPPLAETAAVTDPDAEGGSDDPTPEADAVETDA